MNIHVLNNFMNKYQLKIPKNKLLKHDILVLRLWDFALKMKLL